MRAAKQFAALMHRLAEAVERLSEEETAAILISGAEIRPLDAAGVAPTRSARGRQKSRWTEADLSVIRRDLEALPSREAGLALLDERCSSREQLEQLLRSWDLPYRKGETRAQMMDNLVAAAIGYRLHSEAIQGSLPTAKRNSDDKGS